MGKKGMLFLLVGPSGAGKNTLLTKVVGQLPNLTQMPTPTTRPRRAGEIEGQQHFFLSEEEFDRLIREDGFAEWQVVHGNRYGTLKSAIEQMIDSGEGYIADIDVLGASVLKESYPDIVTLVFIRPPSIEVLEKRIRERGNMSDEEVATRLSRAEFELSFVSKCDYIVVNDDLEKALEQLKGIILAAAERDHRDR